MCYVFDGPGFDSTSPLFQKKKKIAIFLSLSFENFESFFGLLFNDQALKMIFSLMIRLLFNDQACFMKVRGKGGGGGVNGA